MVKATSVLHLSGVPMLSALLMIVVLGLICGVALWGLAQLPWIDGNIKQLIRVVVIVVFAIWAIIVIAGIFGVHVPVVR